MKKTNKTGITKRPIFVLGCDRSGTSLLRRILDSHPDIACPPETKFIFPFAKVFENYQSIKGLKDMGFGEEEVLERMRSFIRGFMDEYALRKGKTRWAEKTAHNTYCVNTIDKIFGRRVVYIAIVRHGLDVACSFSKVKHHKFTVIDKYRTGGANTLSAAVRHWAEQNKTILDFKRKAGKRLLVIKYEDLTRDPEGIMKHVCAFLGEKWFPEMLNYNRYKHDKGFDDPKSASLKNIKINDGLYKKWPLKLQKRLFAQGRDIFKRLGYGI